MENTDTYSSSLKTKILIIFFIFLVIIQFLLPVINKLIINNIINNNKKKEIINNKTKETEDQTNISPVEINDIYISSYYTLVLIVYIIIGFVYYLNKKILFSNQNNNYKNILNFLFIDINNKLNTITIEYLAILLFILIILFCIQIYRYIDDVLIYNYTNNYISIIPSYHYSYNSDKYTSDLKKKKFPVKNILNISDYLSIFYILIPLIGIILMLLKYQLFDSTLIFKYEEVYKYIFIIGSIIYLILLIKSIIAINKYEPYNTISQLTNMETNELYI
jgi:hypothetical protein